jgi:hypothetical protein
VLISQVTGPDYLPQLALFAGHDIGVRARQRPRAYGIRMHSEGSQPVVVNIGQGDQAQAERLSHLGSVVRIGVHVHRAVCAGGRDDLLPARVDLAAGLDRDDGLSHAAPPRAGLLSRPAQAALAAVSH